jgi:aminomethyltransferase
VDFSHVTVKETAGYAALRHRAAWIDLSSRGKIRVSGEDRARLLHALSTNHVEQLRPGQGCYAFFLNAQGRILADANILCFEDHLLLDTEPETRGKLLEHIDRYVIADDVMLEDVTDRFATIAVEGPEAAAILERAGAAIPEVAYSSTLWGDRIVARLGSTGSGGFCVLAPPAEKAAVVSQLGIVEASLDDARRVRIENGRPRCGEEITERNLVAETGQLHAVHFNKGCYLGQEIVERVRSRGQIHRVLRRVEIETENPPSAGTKTDRAEIAGAVFSPAVGKTVALAYVKVESAEPGTEFEFYGARARVT